MYNILIQPKIHIKGISRKLTKAKPKFEKEKLNVAFDFTISKHTILKLQGSIIHIST
jgi:hypothetical protein